MKPLTKYYSDDFCQALPWPRKAAVYLASQADARIAELERDNLGLRSTTLQQADRIAELQAERDAARADAERLREACAREFQALQLVREQRDQLARIVADIAGEDD